MKLFQNPIVVGALALVAGWLVFRNAIQPLLKRNVPVKKPPVAKTVSAPQAASVVTKAEPSSPVASTNQARSNAAKSEGKLTIDLARVGWNIDGSPPRDPFQLMGSLSPPARLGPAASEVLKLTGIWRQTGDSLAVVNARVVGVGEDIEGYRIEGIENGVVWVVGPAGRESLEIYSVDAGKTNETDESQMSGVDADHEATGSQ